MIFISDIAMLGAHDGAVNSLTPSNSRELKPWLIVLLTATDGLLAHLRYPFRYSKLGSFRFATGRMYLASIKSLVWPVWSRICHG